MVRQMVPLMVPLMPPDGATDLPLMGPFAGYMNAPA